MSDLKLAQVKRCPTNVLPDTPTKDDSFGHEVVSRAIADLISTSVGGKAIALTGSWGSGKSSVIEILAAELRSNEDAATETFLFDAWAHQGDPLRRSFLEQLVSQLTKRGWLKRTQYRKERISELTRRLQRVSTTSTPILTIWGGLFAILLLLAPVGLELVSKYDSQKFNHPRWAIAGFVLAVLPFVFGVGAFLCLRPTWKFWQRRFWETNKEPHQESSVLGLLLNKTQEKNESSAIHTPDPTSVEFQQFFREILEEALSEKNRKLLVAVDNLDRVDADDARAVWATLKAFFDFGAQLEADWLSRVWLIVPFDPSALKRLWNGNDPKTTTRGSTEFSDNLVDSFADKTFQITFRVSPPVLSDWRAFFEKQLRLAFPMNHEKDFHALYRIYDLKRLAASRPPTPRDIKIFINRVGAIHRQWQDEISLTCRHFTSFWLGNFPNLRLNWQGVLSELAKVVNQLGGGWLRHSVLQSTTDLEQTIASLPSGTFEDSQWRSSMQARLERCLMLVEFKHWRGTPEEAERQLAEYKNMLSHIDSRALARSRGSPEARVGNRKIDLLLPSDAINRGASVIPPASRSAAPGAKKRTRKKLPTGS